MTVKNGETEKANPANEKAERQDGTHKPPHAIKQISPAEDDRPTPRPARSKSSRP